MNPPGRDRARRIRIGLLLALIVVAAVLPTQVQAQSDNPRTPARLGVASDLDVAYGDHERQRYDVYLPDGDGPFPAVVWIHGGGWTAFDKSRSTPVWDWPEHGYAVVAINYRYATDGDTVAESTADAIAGVAHLIAHADRWDIDPDRVGVYGFSAGGHLAAMVASADLGVAAVVSSAAPTDFEPLVDPERSVFEGRPPADAAAVIRGLLGCDDGDCDDEVAELSPARLPAGPAPVLVLHGDRDLIVDPSQAEAFGAHLEAEGATVELRIVEDVGHRPMEDERVLAFFRTHVG